MKRMLVTVLAAAAVGLIGSLAPASADTLTVGVYPNNPPWEVKQTDSSMEGFEVDLVKAIADKLGDTVDFKDMGFQALFAATSSQRIDMAISTISITPERLKGQDFTQPYFDSDLALITKEGAPLKSLDGMKGKTIGAIAASTGEAWVQAHMKQYGIADYKSYPSQQNLLLDVQSGRIDGAIGETSAFLFAFRQMKNMHVVARIDKGERFAIMMPKGSPILQKVDSAITELKKEGYLAKLHQKWLGAPAPKGSSTVEVRPLPEAS
ncbi:ABC transporter substrate-binding protein [Pararhizobium mangrovi]|uniref:Amino acid ABC transporter substrate-binding protein n=1 Tax=Pararhizobium mangrovi TaxID=2590452 RepID=A0A506UBB9_9HYPH|nr:ABC transporter substrate-binding protein [Pararhizobium mangrovi]TPW30205.1 amino acid ABC transporter substrate-binding protein [Pararhizobium mangrovi]